MSDVDTAPTGAEVAPVANAETPQATTVPETTTEQTETRQEEGQPRDEKGKFAPVQQRINELTRLRYEAERRAEASERRLQEIERQPARVPDPEREPDAYVDHLINERAQAIAEERAQQSHQQQEQQRFQSLVQQMNAREAEYVIAHPDYPEVAQTLASVIGPNPMLFEVIATSDHGPAVAHYLGNHLDEAANIARLPPHLAAAAVVRLEAKVSAIKQIPVTKAPTPAPTVGGGGAVVQKDPSRMNDSEWFASRRAQR